MSKLNPVPSISLPSNPYSLAWPIATLSLCIARGYSALTYIRPFDAPMLYPHIAIASSTECGSPSRTERSMNAPGSPSSALQTTYFSSLLFLLAISHFSPVGNPAPPRPLWPESLISFMTSRGVISVRTLPSAIYPSLAIYSSMFSGLMKPQFLSTILSCFLKKPMCFESPMASFVLGSW